LFEPQILFDLEAEVPKSNLHEIQKINIFP